MRTLNLNIQLARQEEAGWIGTKVINHLFKYGDYAKS
jgi:hypothetical protein